MRSDVRRVRLIELEHRELGVVLTRQPFVAEVAVDLVDPLESADDEALQVQLRRDPHEQLHVERVVMRDERARGGAADDRMHHRRLDLEEVARVEELADAAHDLRALAEHRADVGIDREIDVALAIARLDVARGRATCRAAGAATS